jgi:hypothetical protein
MILMDREDARFVAGALRSLISGDAAEIDRLAASSLLRLSACVGTIERLNAAPPKDPRAQAGSEALQAIIQGGAEKALELPASIAELLEGFAQMLEDTADQTRPPNRAERRANGSRNTKRAASMSKLIGFDRPALVTAS